MLNTGQIVSETIKRLLEEAVRANPDVHTPNEVYRAYNQAVRELADYLGVSRPYMPRKIQAGSWSAGDIDLLALYFGQYPQDFVPGPHDDGWDVASAERKAAHEKATREAQKRAAEA